MWSRSRARQDGISVVAVFHNMQREGPRTLLSLTPTYQSLPEDMPYEVLAIDNGSTAPMSSAEVRAFGPAFRHVLLERASASPCEALNHYIDITQNENVLVLIDGARILSPGILNLSRAALRAFPHPFVYTLGMHLGDRPQNFLVAEGYDQELEDKLLQTVDWRANGYSLFTISSVALSSKQGFFSQLSESNCFCARKQDLRRIGMFNTGFGSPGGGLSNLDIFNRFHEAPWIQPVMLLGEATYHQFHGGVATNVPMERHPWEQMAREYLQVTGSPYQNRGRAPVYLGTMRTECLSLFRVGVEPAR